MSELQNVQALQDALWLLGIVWLAAGLGTVTFLMVRAVQKRPGRRQHEA